MSTESLLDQFIANRRRAQEEAAAEFHASGDAIPDIDFTPPCPICGADLYTDDGSWFGCEVCRIAWPRNGYGVQAEPWT